MFRTLIAALAVFLIAAPALAQNPPGPEPVRVMILGSWHFGNPGQDVHNMQADPVTTPERQAELAAVAQALARFGPTAVALERVAADQATLLDHRWPQYAPESLLTNPDERVQIGYRLAAAAGVERVYAIDEQPEEGEALDYFPYGAVVAWAQANDRSADLDAMQGPVVAYLSDLEARQRTETIGALLADVNRPDHPFNGVGAQAFYYGFLRFGGGRDLPGAELNARWYERNAKIFAKLMQVARPGDRIVVIFGTGHNYWLRHFVETTPGFELVEPGDYLLGL